MRKLFAPFAAITLLIGVIGVSTGNSVAAENLTVSRSLTFATGSSVLTSAHKASLKKVVKTAGKTGMFKVSAGAGKLPLVSDEAVKRLAKKRGQEVKAYLVSLGVDKTKITITVKTSRLGVVPKTRVIGSSLLTSASPSASPSPSPSPSASPSPAYAVGDVGPGGGIVYYVDNTGFNCGSGFTATGSPTGGKCNYLEVAPSGWNSGTDPVKAWAVTANQGADVSGITNEIGPNNSSSGIGLGYKNSALIVTQNGTYDASTNNYAAGAARTYAGNFKSDWYLPTTAELNLLCQWNNGLTQIVTTRCTGGINTINTGTGAGSSGFIARDYWSSSTGNADVVWYQGFGTGFQDASLKDTTNRVRPVRAF